tara:strand:- start:57 stop:1094 length:1038 start_codon:yes stop_codon:yes gene_type:complete
MRERGVYTIKGKGVMRLYFVIKKKSKEEAKITHKRFVKTPRKLSAPMKFTSTLDEVFMFNAMEIPEERQVNFLGDLVEELGLLKVFTKLTKEMISEFSHRVRDHYFQNPFHSWIHALDVTEMVFQTLMSGAREYLEPIQQLGLLLAAICHDLGHPGKSNQYLIKHSKAIAIQYNDVSVLENFHACEGWKLVQEYMLDKVGDNEGMLRKVFVKSILATDLGVHFALLEEWNKEIEEEKEVDEILMCRMLLHMADLGNVLRDFPIAVVWSEKIYQERKMELELDGEEDGMPSVAEFNMGFVKLFVEPMMEAVIKKFPQWKIMKIKLKENEELWKTYKEDGNGSKLKL